MLSWAPSSGARATKTRPGATKSQQGHPRAAAGSRSAFFPGLEGCTGDVVLTPAGEGVGGTLDLAATLPLPRGPPSCVGNQNVLVLLLNDARRSKLFYKTSYRSHTPHHRPEPHPAQKIPV